MGIKRLLYLAGLCVLSPGCSMYESGLRTVVLEPAHYCTNVDRYAECFRNRLRAKAAWHDVREACPDQSYSADYEDGFKDGFADYLMYDEVGEPPPVPPRRYWKVHYQTPGGHQAMGDWFAGFRHGVTAAQASGYRQWAPVLTSTGLPTPGVPVIPMSPGEPGFNARQPSLGIPAPAPIGSMAQPEGLEVLPPPRKVEWRR